jgi:diguanylate cyclase (GGDEF)-like protein/PAS domain S-box-containing protein
MNSGADETLLAMALEGAANAVFVAERDGRIVWANAAFCRQSGYAREEIVGRNPRLFKSGKQGPDFYRDLWQCILAGRPWQGELVERRRDGSFYTVSQVISPLLDARARVTHFVAMQFDISASVQERDEIRQLAYHDSLTGLPNRAQFLRRLGEAIGSAAGERRRLAVLFLDIDNFKSVNDVHGHAVGDLLLAAVADRMRAAVRKTDTVARMSGDEFTILLSDLANTGVARTLARKLIASIAQPFGLDGRTIDTRVSIGIALFPEDGGSAETLLAHADAAMYRAKTRGRGGFCFACAGKR